MTIQTRRCAIRPFQESDIDDFTSYRNDAQWMRYQGYKGLTRDAYARDLLAKPSLAGGAQYAIVSNESGRCIGDIFLLLEKDTLWLGYTIAPDVARQGYAREAAEAVVRWARDGGYTAIRAAVLPDNTPSISLLEKMGFLLSGEEGGGRIYALSLRVD